MVAVSGAIVEREWSRKTATSTTDSIRRKRGFVAVFLRNGAAATLALRVHIRYPSGGAEGGHVMDRKTIFILALGIAIILLFGFYTAL